MNKVLIVYYSRSGNTRKLAEAVAAGVKQAGGACDCRPVHRVKVDDLPRYRALILGSPTYYGQMAAQIKKFIDRSVKLHGRLAGMVGGAFTTSGGTHCGAETCLLSMLTALLIHGMIVAGDASESHYGPAAVGAPNKAALERAKHYGRKICRLAARVND